MCIRNISNSDVCFDWYSLLIENENKIDILEGGKGYVVLN